MVFLFSKHCLHASSYSLNPLCNYVLSDHCSHIQNMELGHSNAESCQQLCGWVGGLSGLESTPSEFRDRHSESSRWSVPYYSTHTLLYSSQQRVWKKLKEIQEEPMQFGSLWYTLQIPNLESWFMNVDFFPEIMILFKWKSLLCTWILISKLRRADNVEPRALDQRAKSR